MAAVSLLWRAHLWRRAAYNPDTLRLRVELGGAHLDLALSRRVCPWVVCEVDVGRLEARDVAREGADMYLWVRLDDLNLVLEVHWAVTLNLERLLVGLAYLTASAHVDEFGEELVLGRVYNGERMNGDQDLVAITVDSHGVVVILVFVDSGRELDVNLFGDARRDHPLLLVSDLEVARLRGQDVEALRSRRIINESQLHSVRFICLEACELDHAGRSLEHAVRAHSVVSVLFGNADSFVCLGLGYDTTLNLNLVLTVGRWLVPEALFKLLTCGIIEPKPAHVAADGGPPSCVLG